MGNCVFRSIPAIDYARFRPPITVDSGHPLRSIPAAYYGDLGPPCLRGEESLDKSTHSL